MAFAMNFIFGLMS